MGATKLKQIGVYLTLEEWRVLKAEADEYEVTLAAAIRSKLGLPRIERGAPDGNINRLGIYGKPKKAKK